MTDLFEFVLCSSLKRDRSVPTASSKQNGPIRSILLRWSMYFFAIGDEISSTIVSRLCFQRPTTQPSKVQVATHRSSLRRRFYEAQAISSRPRTERHAVPSPLLDRVFHTSVWRLRHRSRFSVVSGFRILASLQGLLLLDHLDERQLVLEGDLVRHRPAVVPHLRAYGTLASHPDKRLCDDQIVLWMPVHRGGLAAFRLKCSPSESMAEENRTIVE